MLPCPYYTTESGSAIPIHCVSEKDYPLQYEIVSDREKNILTTQHFQGKLGQYVYIHQDNGLLSQIWVGLGTTPISYGLAKITPSLPENTYVLKEKMSYNTYLYWGLAQYQFREYQSASEINRVLVVPPEYLNDLCLDIQTLFLTRDLINAPANRMHPEALSTVTQEIAQAYQAQFQSWIGDALLQDNFPAIHAVGRAADYEPRLLSITYGDPKHPKVTLIGKGVCFDTGGLNIKVDNMMRLMKKDMGGAAHVLAIAQWIMTQKLPIYLQVLIPAVENSIDGNAYRPGDVITMRNGLHVEIDNTDAEGRLILADAISKACEDKPELIIDFATLTGAARIAVGTDIAAMFCNDDATANALLQIGEEMEDPIWRMPLFKGYNGLLQSYIADCTNSGKTSYAGAIVAALFLQKFVQNDPIWVHFDMMAWNLSSSPGKPEGGEAMGVRAVCAFLKGKYGT